MAWARVFPSARFSVRVLLVLRGAISRCAGGKAARAASPPRSHVVHLRQHHARRRHRERVVYNPASRVKRFDMAKVTIYHNPNCGTSRNVLAMLQEGGHEPEVIEYLRTPPTREQLKELVRKMGVPLREILREKGTPYAELDLGDPSLTDEQLLDAIEKHPILMN